MIFYLQIGMQVNWVKWSDIAVVRLLEMLSISQKFERNVI